MIEEELSQDLVTKGTLSDWFSRDESAPSLVTLRKKPNPRNVANAAKNQVFDPVQVAADVDSLMHSESPVAPLVREAMRVIDDALDLHG